MSKCNKLQNSYSLIKNRNNKFEIFLQQNYSRLFFLLVDLDTVLIYGLKSVSKKTDGGQVGAPRNVSVGRTN